MNNMSSSFHERFAAPMGVSYVRRLLYTTVASGVFCTASPWYSHLAAMHRLCPAPYHSLELHLGYDALRSFAWTRNESI